MKRKQNKGFTLVELLVVISIVAVLSTVSVVGYMAFRDKANKSNDDSLVSQMNTALQADEVLNGKPKHPTAALEVLAENGILLDKVKPAQKDYSYLWNLASNRVVLVDAEMKVSAPSNFTLDEAHKENYFTFIGSPEDRAKFQVSGQDVFSYYLNDGFTASTFEASTGFDVGNNPITTAKYTNTSGTAKSVVLRASSADTNLVIDAPLDNITRYGTNGDLLVNSVASESLHIAGNVTGEVTIKKGHIVVEENSSVNTIVVPADATGDVSISNNGQVSVVDTTKATQPVEVDNSGQIDISVGTTEIKGNQSTIKYEETKTLAEGTNAITSGGYYDCSGITLSSKGETGSDKFALLVQTNEKVVISGINLTGLRGIELYQEGIGDYNFSLINSTINVSQRGIQLWFDDGKPNENAVINISNCKINNTSISDYDNNTSSGTSGIMLNGTKGVKLNVKDTTIQGFGYSVQSNFYGGQGGNKDLSVVVDNSVLKGRAGFDLISMENSKLECNNTLIRGINTFKGTSESFGLVVLETGSINNNISFKNCTFEGYIAPATEYNHEYAFDVRDSGNTINLKGSNTFNEDIHFPVGSENAPKDYSTLLPMNKIVADNNINGNFVKATCNIFVGDNKTTFDWLKK